MIGTLALVGGGEFGEACSFDGGLVAAGGAEEVLILPTGAAYEDPSSLVAPGVAHFERLGVAARGLPVLNRRDALDSDNAAALRASRCTYIVGGSPMHLRSVLKDSPCWDALLAAWGEGGTLVGSDAGAMVLCDPMVDPRGGAFTLGLGLLDGLTVMASHDRLSEDAVHRTRKMTPPGLVLVGIDQRTALIREPEGTWRAEGAGAVVLFLDGHPAMLDDLPSGVG